MAFLLFIYLDVFVFDGLLVDDLIEIVFLYLQHFGQLIHLEPEEDAVMSYHF